MKLLKDRGIQVQSTSEINKYDTVIAVTIDRSGRRLCILLNRAGSPDDSAIRVPVSYHSNLEDDTVAMIDSFIFGDPQGANPSQDPKARAVRVVRPYMDKLLAMFKETEAYNLHTVISADPQTQEITVNEAKFQLDDAAFRSAKRQSNLHALREVDKEDPEEIEAEKDGIVYIKLDTAGANIGTLGERDAKLHPPTHRPGQD